MSLQTPLQTLQLERLNGVLAQARKRPFYGERLANLSLPLGSLDELSAIAPLTKTDLMGSREDPVGKIFDGPRDSYVRLHQTSGTKGFPMTVLDNADDWHWWLECWDHVLDAAQVTSADIAMMAFSFGPFIGFWTANDALVRRGSLVVPGGGLTSENRLQMILKHGCTVVCCTPTYAMHLANVAERSAIDLPGSRVTRIIVAGEPGGSVAAVRSRIEQSWGATVVDHCGASELGAWGVGSADGRGIHVIETEFIAELLHFDEDHPGGAPANDGEEAELVLTNLGRLGGPAIRYRTGDIVRGYRRHDQPNDFLWLEGGVLGRADDMMVIRGVNIFPSSIEAIIRELEPAAEFRMIASRSNEMDQLAIEIEADYEACKGLEALFRDRLAMRVPVAAVPVDTLPRFEAKSRRLVDRRGLSES